MICPPPNTVQAGRERIICTYLDSTRLEFLIVTCWSQQKARETKPDLCLTKHLGFDKLLGGASPCSERPLLQLPYTETPRIMHQQQHQLPDRVYLPRPGQ